MKTKALYLTVALGMMLGFSSCNLDYFPSDEMNSSLLLQDSKGAEYIMNACYALMKDEVEFLGYQSGNYYARHYFQLAEFPGDNICLSSHTTDPLYEATAYMMNDGLKNIGTLWMVAYKIIYMSNNVIGTLDASNPDNNQLLGEAYFTRALMHLQLVTLCAKPYSFGRDNLGIPLRTSVGSEETKRESVGKVYDQIAEDFRKAADLMGASRGNAGYPCKEAALGLLSRVYLYMGEYDKCIAAVNEALNGATPDSKLEKGDDYVNYFRNAKTSKETLFCIACETTDDRGQSSIGSMFLKDGIGWGEIYPSAPLLNLLERYPTDLRLTGFTVPQYTNKPDTVFVKEWDAAKREWKDRSDYADWIDYKTHPEHKGLPIPSEYIVGIYNERVYFADPETPDGGLSSGRTCLSFRLVNTGGTYTFNDSLVAGPANKQDYTVLTKTVNGEYQEYYVHYKDVDCEARVYKNISERNTNPIIYVNKFSYQDGNPMLSSPVICRWAEVILNAAEAYAHNGDATNALKYVDIIRDRAGIPAAGMFSSNMHGYTSALDVVLDERRMELAYEGFRPHDMFRNKLKMNRQYPGAQPWKIIDPMTENHIIYPIPNNEWTVSGIQQNPGY